MTFGELAGFLGIDDVVGDRGDFSDGLRSGTERSERMQ
jgi:hypothetical protein